MGQNIFRLLTARICAPSIMKRTVAPTDGRCPKVFCGSSNAILSRIIANFGVPRDVVTVCEISDDHVRAECGGFKADVSGERPCHECELCGGHIESIEIGCTACVEWNEPPLFDWKRWKETEPQDYDEIRFSYSGTRLNTVQS